MNRQEPIVDNELYHVYNRGNDGRVIFRSHNDYEYFLGILSKGLVRYDTCLYVYCLMPNHYHLILSQRPNGDLPTMMASIGTGVTKRYNLKYGHTGHLFEGPYESKRIETPEYFLHLARYIHFNPVAARLVGKAHEWRWSSICQFLPEEDRKSETDNDREQSKFVSRVECNIEPILSSFDGSRSEYLEYVNSYKPEDD